MNEYLPVTADALIHRRVACPLAPKGHARVGDMNYSELESTIRHTALQPEMRAILRYLAPRLGALHVPGQLLAGRPAAANPQVRHLPYSVLEGALRAGLRAATQGSK